MEVVLNGVYNFLSFIEENWAMITAIVGLMIAIGKKIKNYLSKSKDEQIVIAKAQIKEIILMLVTESEIDYESIEKAGQIKRGQVIDQIFTMYPVLSKVANQAEVIAWIDEAIDTALKDMRKIFEQQDYVMQK